jgi:hypothetical protein
MDADPKQENLEMDFELLPYWFLRDRMIGPSPLTMLLVIPGVAVYYAILGGFGLGGFGYWVYCDIRGHYRDWRADPKAFWRDVRETAIVYILIFLVSAAYIAHAFYAVSITPRSGIRIHGLPSIVF